MAPIKCLTISMPNLFKKIIFACIFSLLSYSTSGCSVVKQNTYVTPTRGFVQVFSETNITECVPKSPCKIGPVRSVGSGGVIEHRNGLTLILTAAHVCDADFNANSRKTIAKYTTKLFVRIWTGEFAPAKILSSSKDSDLDLCTIYIRTPKAPLSKINLSPRAPVPGDRVTAMAAPAGIYHPPTVPILQGVYSGRIPDKKISMVTIPAQPGASGALILNEENGIVGVIIAVSLQFDHITLAVNYPETRKFVTNSRKIFRRNTLKVPVLVVE